MQGRVEAMSCAGASNDSRSRLCSESLFCKSVALLPKEHKGAPRLGAVVCSSLEDSGGFPLVTLPKPVIDVSPFYISSPSAKRSRRAGLKYRLEKRSRVRLMASDGSEGKSRRCLDRNFPD